MFFDIRELQEFSDGRAIDVILLSVILAIIIFVVLFSSCLPGIVQGLFSPIGSYQFFLNTGHSTR
jgi:hypothetical protein